MPVTSTDDVLDLIKSTLAAFRKNKIVDVSQRLQDYWFYNQFVKGNKVDKLEGGSSIEEYIKTVHTDARMVGLYEDDVLNTGDSMQKVSLPWRFCTHNYTIDERLPDLNNGEKAIFRLFDVREADLILGSAQKMEDQFWGLPSGTTDETNAHGVRYWIVYNASEGQTGGAASGFTTVGGINPSTTTAWKNWSYTYSTITVDDLVADMKTAARKSNFKAPVNMPKAFEKGMDRGYFAGATVISGLESLCEKQNQNLGNDLDSYGGQAMFQRVPLNYVPALDGLTGAPVYQIDFGYFKMKVLASQYMKKHQPIRLPTQHNTISVNIDTTFNFLVNNRRAQAVFATTTVA